MVTYQGDANLDGYVDMNDFGAWNSGNEAWVNGGSTAFASRYSTKPVVAGWRLQRRW